MADPAHNLAEEFDLDVSHLVTEDDQPVENPFQDKQMRLLTESLYTSWQPDFPFVAMSDVGFFFSLSEDPLVPDVLVSTRVSLPKDLMSKKHRSYFAWIYGKVPDIVVEIVSGKEGGELDRKREGYHARNVPYYIVFDPGLELGERMLRSFEYSPSGYVEMVKPLFTSLGLGLLLWSGEYEGHETIWLRWCDAELAVLPFGKEGIESSRALVEEQRAIATQERTRADEMAEELLRLRQMLRDSEQKP